MTDTLLALVPTLGLPLIFAAVYLATLGLPVPGTVAVMVGGAFVASGDFAAGPLASTCFAAAVLGDQTGYWTGALGRDGLGGWLARHPVAAGRFHAAEALAARGGATSVFLSRWLFTAFGPWLNYAAGAARLGWRRFTLASLSGEALWTALYAGLGWQFSTQLETLSELVGTAGLALAGAALAVILAIALIRAARSRREFTT